MFKYEFVSCPIGELSITSRSRDPSDLSDFEENSSGDSFYSHLPIEEINPIAHLGLVLSYAELGQIDEAKKHLDKFTSMAPQSTHIEKLERKIKRAQPIE